jgi:hypothetical protein
MVTAKGSTTVCPGVSPTPIRNTWITSRVNLRVPHNRKEPVVTMIHSMQTVMSWEVWLVVMMMMKATKGRGIGSFMGLKTWKYQLSWSVRCYLQILVPLRGHSKILLCIMDLISSTNTMIRVGLVQYGRFMLAKRVGIYFPNHVCSNQYENTRTDVELLACKYKTNFKDNSTWTLYALQHMVKRYHNINVPLSRC